jgi:hypothetical protein
MGTICYSVKPVLESSTAFYKRRGKSSTDHPLRQAAVQTERGAFANKLITETRKAESSFGTLPGDQNTPITHTQGKGL